MSMTSAIYPDQASLALVHIICADMEFLQLLVIRACPWMALVLGSSDLRQTCWRHVVQVSRPHLSCVSAGHIFGEHAPNMHVLACNYLGYCGECTLPTTSKCLQKILVIHRSQERFSGSWSASRAPCMLPCSNLFSRLVHAQDLLQYQLQ